MVRVRSVANASLRQRHVTTLTPPVCFISYWTTITQYRSAIHPYVMRVEEEGTK